MAGDKLYRRGSLRWYLLGTLTAIELLMSFSFLGYFHFEPISVTIAYIPVLLTGALLGPAESLAVGGVFGLASMWKASASYIAEFDKLFSPVMSGRPLESVILSVGTRMAFGLIVGLLYYGARKSRRQLAWVAVISFFGPNIHSALVYSALWAFFPETGYTTLDALKGFTGINGIFTDLASAAVVLIVWFFLNSERCGKFFARVSAINENRVGERYNWVSLAIVIIVTILSSVAVAIYFVNRMDSSLDRHGVVLTEVERGDLLHLQIQFLIGVMAMMVLVIIFLIFNRRYTTSMDREAMLDTLTGVMNRRSFFRVCNRALRNMAREEEHGCYFIMMDVDKFKEVNDVYGHPEGDRVLKEVAKELETAFDKRGMVGRIGGDEFAVLLRQVPDVESLEMWIKALQERIDGLKIGDGGVSCSMGVQPVSEGKTAETLYKEADKLLYMAKKGGKGMYILGAKATGAE